MPNWKLDEPRPSGSPAIDALNELFGAIFGKDDHKVAKLLRVAQPFVLARTTGAPPWTHVGLTDSEPVCRV